MTRRSRSVGFALVLVLATGVACGNKIDPGAICGTSTQAPRYVNAIKPVLDAHCISCHSSQATDRHGAPGAINLDTYEGAAAHAADSDSTILGGSMPPSPDALTNDERCAFDLWVQQDLAP